MNAHDLAKKLLELPNVPVVIFEHVTDSDVENYSEPPEVAYKEFLVHSNSPQLKYYDINYNIKEGNLIILD